MYLIHYGIEGQKWGVRRWQNPDGTFNEAGKKRYGRMITGKATKLRGQLFEYRSARKDAENLNNEDWWNIRKEFREQKKAVKKSGVSKSERKESIKALRAERQEKVKQSDEIYKKGLEEIDKIFEKKYGTQALYDVQLASKGLDLAQSIINDIQDEYIESN